MGWGVRDRVHCGRVERGTVVSEKPGTTLEALAELARAGEGLKAAYIKSFTTAVVWLGKSLGILR